MLICTCHFLQLSSDDSSDENNDFFFKIVLSGAMLAQIYCDMYLDKNPPRTSTTSGMGWLLETLHTPGECHTQLHMSNEIFDDLHGLLVERYGLKASYHMSSYESLAMFLFTCDGN
jgi:hypothetical protein